MVFIFFTLYFQRNVYDLTSRAQPVLFFGTRGRLLASRYLAEPSYFQRMHRIGYVQRELEHWHKLFNREYALFVEERLHCAVFGRDRTADGHFLRRRDHNTTDEAAAAHVYAPAHLYSSIIQHRYLFTPFV